MHFPSIAEPSTFQKGVQHVSRVDLRIRQLVERQGLIKCNVGGDPFESLVRAIISQQLNGQAAKSIFKKVAEATQSPINAQSLLDLPVSKMRKNGLSPQKIRYLKDLSSRVIKGQLDLRSLKRRQDDDVIRILDEVQGIGAWTAQMFLIFTLGRPDVLPVSDLGIRMAIKKTYSLRKLPEPEKINRIAQNWHPYCSIASLYLWRSKNT